MIINWAAVWGIYNVKEMQIKEAEQIKNIDRSEKITLIYETESAVNFYKSCGGEVTNELDEELFQLEPKDIHMVMRLEQ